MEQNQKTFTIVDTETQLTKEIKSNATNVAELKNDLRAAGFNVEGKTIQEALTRTEFKDDNSLLPHDVPYRGTITNDLVFRLTKTNKNIKSGVDRNALYNEIRNRGLQDEVKRTFGRNMTQVSSDDLVCFLNREHSNTCAHEECKKEKTCKCIEGIKALCHILCDYEFIDEDDVTEVLDACGIKPKSKYSQDELDEILKGL